MSSQLILHRGAQAVDREHLLSIKAPAPSGRWFPIAHGTVLRGVENVMEACGFEIENARYGCTPDGHRFFGTMTLKVPVVNGVQLAVGLRNSTNQTFPLGFCAGHRVFVCDNLSFAAELMVKRKHTRFGGDRFHDDIRAAVSKLEAFRQAEKLRIERMKSFEVSDTEAESWMLRAYEHKIVSHRQLPKIIQHWREPSFEDFEERTLWALFNAFTTVMNDRAKTNPQQHARDTMKLQGLLAPKGADEPGIIEGTATEVPPKG